MTGITSHVLDTSIGQPAAGIAIRLDKKSGDVWVPCGQGVTDDDGRVGGLTDESCGGGHYRIHFAVADYFQRRGVESFYPQIEIEFNVTDSAQHYHVPLLLSPFGFSTYRGS